MEKQLQKPKISPEKKKFRVSKEKEKKISTSKIKVKEKPRKEDSEVIPEVSLGERK